MSIDVFHLLNSDLGVFLVGPCTFPHFNFSSFYLYMEDLLGSNVNVARDRIQFVA